MVKTRETYARRATVGATTLALTLAVSCRDIDYVSLEEVTEVAGSAYTSSRYAGFYLLNEGNMGANKATIDYMDFTTGVYSKNIYADRNPEVVLELGDVGNDIELYGSRLYVVVNCSNKLEVLDAATAKRIGQVDIPNCRYVCFSGAKAYVSSYVSPVGSTESTLGAVYEVDTASLAITRSVAVGYQPEQMVVLDGKLYVANSGGYMPPTYDNTISVVDLDSFAEIKQIEVDINLHHLLADSYGALWVSCRGDYNSVPSNLYVVAGDEVTPLDIPCSNMALRGDNLYVVSTEWSNILQTNTVSYSQVDVKQRKVTSQAFITDGTDAQITTPYGIAVNNETGEIYLTDALNYVSSGTLRCYSAAGALQWSVKTGDIPSTICFVEKGTGTTNATEPTSALTVYDYCPAPGQFVNLLPEYEEGDNAKQMAAKAQERLRNGNLVTLGAYGGYITVGFGEDIPNNAGSYDFAVYGNAITNGAEPGIVLVSYDDNGNGEPDDTWYELAGSNYSSSLHAYQITYTKTTDEADIPWTDSNGDSGYVYRNPYHSQPYYPQWLDCTTLTFTGTRLDSNATLTDGTYILSALPWGYADNYPNSDADGCSFDIDWAVTEKGEPANLTAISFLRIYTALNQSCGILGETSTEVTGVEILQ